MARRRDIGSIAIPAAVFLILEIAAFAMLREGSSLHESWLHSKSLKVSSALWQGKMRRAAKKDLQARYDFLLSENLDLRRRLLSAPQTDTSFVDSTFTYTEALVIKVSSNSQRGTVVLDKGLKDGVEKGDGIITTNGVVGIVDAVYEHYCHGITFQNPGLSVSARVGYGGVAAPIVWDGLSQNSAIFKGVPVGYEVADTLYTSGFSAIYPPRIPLGVPVRMKSTNGATSDYEVRLLLDFSLLHKVLIVKHRFKEEL